MTLELKKIAEKWQGKWEREGVFKVEADKRKKFYIAIVYPYMSGLLHLGHLFTYVPSDILGRYKRMRGFNVLSKFGFHCTGTPIVAAAQRVKEGEKGQIENLKKMGIAEKEIPKFGKAEYWAEYFPKETLKDIKKMGFAIDERYTFRTTSLNPAYDAFIRWQFNKLREGDYVKKGKHPVVWCPKCQAPTGDHARAEGEGETPTEYLLLKHKLEDGRFLVSATLRQDTVLGITNLFVHPEFDYLEAEVKKGEGKEEMKEGGKEEEKKGKEKGGEKEKEKKGEMWILGENCVKSLREQGFEIKIKSRVKGKELIGQKTEEFGGRKVLILPAAFLEPKFGTGLVHSVPSDSADDLIALKELQRDEETLKKYKLDIEEVKKIKPIPVLKMPGYSEIPAEDFLKKYGVKSQKEKEKLERIKKELYKLSHHTATLNYLYSQGFAKNLEGKKVEEAKGIIKEELIKGGYGVPFYELSGRVVCRCLTECVVKIVADQWFIEYNEPAWKKRAHECLKGMKLYPKQIRKQFEYVLDWLDHWACTREFGLGTKLPWDEKWVIESLSDSTIQMAYGTIAKYLEHPSEYGFKAEKLNDKFFEYICLGKGKVEEVEKSTGIRREMVEKMRSDFEYWYPFDFRNSAKDLVQNHLAFCIFNHVALFPKKHWPQAFMVNGRIMVNNEKMSKSKGNFFTMRELYEKHGPEAVRLTAAKAGEGIDDANYEMGFLETANKKLEEMYYFIENNYNKGDEEHLLIDEWLESKINEAIQKTTEALEEKLFKSGVEIPFSEMSREIKWYLKRRKGKPNKKLMNLFIETQLKLLAPFIPHFCEEGWERIKGKGFVSQASWPKAEGKKIKPELDKAEEILRNNLYDIREAIKLSKIEKPSLIRLFVAEGWKYTFDLEMKKLLEKTRNQGEIMKEIMRGEMKKYGKEISKLVPMIIKDPSKLSGGELDQRKEILAWEESKSLIEEEFGCKVEILVGGAEEKAKKARPGKVGVWVE